VVLGALPEAVSQEVTLDVNLRQGDRIVLYSDGITEVSNSRDEMLGVPGLREFVREAALLPLGEMMGESSTGRLMAQRLAFRRRFACIG
jgi:serine phosphatase RsbU (regulator of sigma subunit)